jgi:methionyl aminopeptidase
MAIMIKTMQEIEKMRISGKALRQVHNAIAPHVVAGASTMDHEEVAVKKIAELGGIAAFKGYHGYPSALCTSVNEEVVHGMPNAKRILKEGDILSIDCGVIIDGFYSDAAVTYPIGKVCEAEGFGVVRDFVGHGIGRSMHEDPQVPNFGSKGKGPRLKAGMVLAIEPMINAGGPEVRVLKDGWTAVTVDGSYSAHFEHTVALTKDGPLVLTR